MKNIYLLLAAVSILACEPKVLFKNALPPEGKILQTIPTQFQGVYYSECDTTILHVLPDVIYTEGYFEFTTTITRVHEEEGCRIADQGMYLRGTKECVPFEYLNGDTIRVKLVQKDTMFLISKHQVAKLYKNSIYLNHQDKNYNWVASRVTARGDGSLLWQLVDVPNKVDKVREITKDYKSYIRSDDEEIFVINPTQIEFETLLNKGYLKECDVFIPLNFEINY